jgi:hypothetical protein
MINEIPQYGLRAYALFYLKHSLTETFMQNELDFIVSNSMKKKIFSLLLRNGWIKKKSRDKYKCVNPKVIFNGLLEFKVPNIIKNAEKSYAFTDLSAVEIWSDYCYVQRGIERSPYFINVLKKDLRYWKNFFSNHSIPYYVNDGSTIGEYIILIPVNKLSYINKDDFKVISLRETLKIAKNNEMYNYPYNYMREKYGKTTA